MYERNHEQGYSAYAAKPSDELHFQYIKLDKYMSLVCAPIVVPLEAGTDTTLGGT